MTIRRHMTGPSAMLLGCILLASASGATAQTCRTSLSTGMILCDNGSTARTSPVAGTTTFSDGRTAQTSTVTGTTRFSDGTSFRTVPVETVSAPLPPARLVPDAATVEETVPPPAIAPPRKSAKSADKPFAELRIAPRHRGDWCWRSG